MTKSHEQRLDTVVEVIATGYRAVESYQWASGDAMASNLGRVDDPKSEDVKNEVNEILNRLALYGIELAFETVRAWWYYSSINPPEKRNGVSFTAAQECGSDPKRFAWFAEYGAGLSKREVRRLRGKKVDTAIGSATELEKFTGAIEALLERKLDTLAVEILLEIEDEDMVDTLLEKFPQLQKRYDAAFEHSSGGGGGRSDSEWDSVDKTVEAIDRFTDALSTRYEALAGKLTPEVLGQTRLLESISRLRSTLDLFESGLTEGLTFEQFVASLDE